MLSNALFVIFLALMVAGCASDDRVVSTDTSSSMTSSGGTAMSSPPAAAPNAAATESRSMNQSSSKSRIAAGVEEETLDTCLGRIPKDATTGQKMLAEQTCRRDYASR